MSTISRPVPLPEDCTCLLGVLTAEPLDRVDDFALPSPQLLRRFGAGENDLERVAARPHLFLMAARAPVGEAAASALAVRLAALALAEAHDGVVVDLAVPRVVGTDRPDLTVARQWVAFDLDGDDVTSRGLDAFGLPELRVAVTDPATVPAILAVLTGLVHRLLTEWPAQDPVGPAAVTLADVARGMGDEAADRLPTGQHVGVLIDYVGGVLRVDVVDDPRTLFG